MTSKLRWRFVRTTMVVTLPIVVVIAVAINVFNAALTYQRIDEILDTLCDSAQMQKGDLGADGIDRAQALIDSEASGAFRRVYPGDVGAGAGSGAGADAGAGAGADEGAGAGADASANTDTGADDGGVLGDAASDATSLGANPDGASPDTNPDAASPDGASPDASPDSASPDATLPSDISKKDFPLTPTLRFFIVDIEADGEVSDIRLDNAATIDSEGISYVVSEILALDKTEGMYSDYAFRIVGDDQRTAVIVDASSLSSQSSSLLVITLVTCVAAYVLVFLVVLISSRRAVAPIAKNYERQRQFVADVGHELKTPLTVISVDNELAQEIYGTNEWSQGIAKQTRRMSDLIEKMITLAKLDEDKASETVTMSLSDIVTETFEAYEGVAMKAHKELKLSVQDGIDVRGNEADIRQLVSIVADNAFKYCDEGGHVSVSLSLGKRVALRVENTCANASEIDYASIFDRFHREDKARSSEGGFGLGLAIAHAIVENHKGSITARSTHDGQAVEFAIDLPAV